MFDVGFQVIAVFKKTTPSREGLHKQAKAMQIKRGGGDFECAAILTVHNATSHIFIHQIHVSLAIFILSKAFKIAPHSKSPPPHLICMALACLWSPSLEGVVS